MCGTTGVFELKDTLLRVAGLYLPERRWQITVDVCVCVCVCGVTKEMLKAVHKRLGYSRRVVDS